MSKDPSWPNPDELRKDMEEFFTRKYGDRVRLGVLSAQPDQARTADEGTETTDAPLNLQFDYLPRDIKNYLDRFVIRQESAKKVLATAICDHYNHIKRCSSKGPCKEYAKQNIIMVGPTGVGKTYLVRTIADLIGVPFVKADATKFSETGYVGRRCRGPRARTRAEGRRRHQARRVRHHLSRRDRQDCERRRTCWAGTSAAAASSAAC